ncbi:MAG: AAA family ATPase, partial [Lachnospiraceae bacterium]|nr:AAA family ATPase [Lachnospiraceae bacterium]
PIQKITIDPRTMGALGYAWYVPEEEKHLESKDELYEQIVTALAGRAAEEIIFASITNGASNDIEKATSLARSMVTRFGMSDRFGLIKLESMEDRYLSGRMVMECADETAAGVDEEVMKILSNAYEEAKRLLNENRDLLDTLAEYLLQKESITGKQFMEIFRTKYPEEKKTEEDNSEKDNPEEDMTEDAPEDADKDKGTVVDAKV